MKRTLFFVFLFLFIFMGCSRSEKLTSPDHYILKSYITERVMVNSPAEFSVEIIPTDGFKMEVEAPINLRFDTVAYSDLIFEKDIYTKSDLLNQNIKKPIFKGKITPKNKGEYLIKGELSFVVCTDTVCEPKKTEINLRIIAE